MADRFAQPYPQQRYNSRFNDPRDYPPAGPISEQPHGYSSRDREVDGGGSISPPRSRSPVYNEQRRMMNHRPISMRNMSAEASVDGDGDDYSAASYRQQQRHQAYLASRRVPPQPQRHYRPERMDGPRTMATPRPVQRGLQRQSSRSSFFSEATSAYGSFAGDEESLALGGSVYSGRYPRQFPSHSFHSRATQSVYSRESSHFSAERSYQRHLENFRGEMQQPPPRGSQYHHRQVENFRDMQHMQRPPGGYRGGGSGDSVGESLRDIPNPGMRERMMQHQRYEGVNHNNSPRSSDHSNESYPPGGEPVGMRHHHQHGPPSTYSGERGFNNPTKPPPADGEAKTVEISPGVFARLRGAHETWDCIQRDFYQPVKCMGCTVDLCCIQDADYVICPLCRVVGPMDTGDYPGKKGGVGLGFTLEELGHWQRDIAMKYK